MREEVIGVSTCPADFPLIVQNCSPDCWASGGEMVGLDWENLRAEERSGEDPVHRGVQVLLLAAAT